MTAESAIIRARSALVMSQPFFGCLALHLTIAERPDVTGTMATDGAHLFYAAPFVEGLTESELLGVVAHEVMHCAYSHFARLGNRDARLFNEAADYAINRDLIAAGFTLPSGALISAEFDGMGAEEIYSILQRRQRNAKPSKPQIGKPGDSGNGGAGAPGQSANGGGDAGAADSNGTGDAAAHGMGGIVKPGDGGQADCEAMADKWQVIARQAANVAKAANAGTMPGFAERAVAEISTPVADYRQLLADWIDSRVASDYSFSRPNRRLLHAGFVLPGAVVDGLEHVIFAVDTSGSIDADMINNAASEIVAAMESGKIDRLTVIFADSRVRHVQEFSASDDIKLEPRGGGGTAFADTFDWIADNARDATACVYLTDLHVSEFGAEPDMPVLWAVHGDSRDFEGLAARVPFGDPVYIGRL